ncbi:hypothetical protein RRF57_009580 [Xylaria bambusicola]|uniref:Uncharacterized protein n=1 Tax=Xylaria bambusicola TaxID=326684 RepID=A0AAN7UX18_9PEZI
MVAFLERRGGNYMPAQRLVTRKAAKALDQQAEKIAFLEAKVKTLQARLKKSIKKKRKKVKPAPGRRFAMMADVRVTDLS